MQHDQRAAGALPGAQPGGDVGARAYASGTSPGLPPSRAATAPSPSAVGVGTGQVGYRRQRDHPRRGRSAGRGVQRPPQRQVAAGGVAEQRPAGRRRPGRAPPRRAGQARGSRSARRSPGRPPRTGVAGHGGRRAPVARRYSGTTTAQPERAQRDCQRPQVPAVVLPAARSRRAGAPRPGAAAARRALGQVHVGDAVVAVRRRSAHRSTASGASAGRVSTSRGSAVRRGTLPTLAGWRLRHRLASRP